MVFVFSFNFYIYLYKALYIVYAVYNLDVEGERQQVNLQRPGYKTRNKEYLLN